MPFMRTPDVSRMSQQNPLLPVPVDEPTSTPPATATGLTNADLARLRRSLDSSVSDNTRAMYNSAWKNFEKWAQARGALALPASSPLVAAYLAHLAEERRLSVATVRLHKSALAAGHPDPTDNEPVRQILKGIARAHGKPQKQARPLTAEAAALTWGDVEFRSDGAALITLRRSKTDQEAEGVVLYLGREAAQALQAIRPAPELLDLKSSVFGMTARNIGKRVMAAARAAGLGDGYTGHSGRVGMAQDLVKSGVELPALMTAGRWKSSKMPARYTERQAADRGAVARYYQVSGG